MYRCEVCGEYCVLFGTTGNGVEVWTHDENSPAESRHHIPVPVEVVTLYTSQCPRCPYQAVGPTAVELQADVLDHDLEAHGILPMDSHG